MKFPATLVVVACFNEFLLSYCGKVYRRSTDWSAINAQRTPSTQILTICWIMEDDSYYTSFNRSAAAVDLGIEHANNFIMPRTLKLQSIFKSSGSSCTRTMFTAVTNTYELLTSGVNCDLYLGASCSYTAAAIYGFAKKNNTPIFGCPGVGFWSLQTDARKIDFPLVVLPTYGYSDTSDFVIQLLKRFNYTSVSVYRDDSYTVYQLVSDNIMRYLRDREPVVYQNSFTTTFRSLRTTPEMYRQLLTASNERARVYLIFAHAAAVRKLMLTAYELGYTQGSHVFFALELYDLAYWGKIDPTTGDSFDTIAAQAYQSLLVISFFDRKEIYDAEFAKQVKSLARERYGYLFNPLEPLDPVLIAHYEAIVLYALLVTDLYQSGDNASNYTDGLAIISNMLNSSFEGFRGSKITIGDDGTRDKDYAIKFYNEATDEFAVYLQFLQHVGENDSTIFRTVSNLKYPSSDGQLPPNEPYCGFRGEKARCRNDGLSPSILATVVVIPLLIFLGVMIAGGLIGYKLWKLRMEYNPNWWKIYTDDLNVKDNRAGGSKKTLNSQSTHGTSNRSGFSSYVCEIFATYNGTTVGLADVSELKRVPTKELLEELKLMKGIDNSNLQHFIGIAVSSSSEICEFVVAELCSKGTLSDILENEMIKLDWFFKNSMIRDLVLGMTYLHQSPIQSHGNLNSFTCLVDIRFTIKISDYGLPFFRPKADLEPVRHSDTDREMGLLLWRAPELLRQLMPPKGTQKGDVYSFAIILQQIILRSDPFELPNDPLEMSDREILAEVIAANIPPVRPRVPRSSCSNELYDLMERSWEEVPIERPTFPKIKERLKKIIGNVGENIVDLLFKRMEQYANDLEQKVADQTQQFMDEKNRSEQLLSQLLPKPVAEALTRGVQVDPEAFQSVTIFFSDIVGFTTLAAKGSPMDVIDLLNALYTFFDGILGKYDVYKVETIGDAYMVSSGLPVRNGNKHASEIASMALDLREGITKFAVPHRPNEVIHIRIGINSGPCVAGIVGLKMPRYCLFGDTVNVASRMESSGEPMKIQISYETRDLLNNIGGFITIERGPVMIKGKGNLITFFLISKQ